MSESGPVVDENVFEIGFRERPSWWESVVLAVQNILGMTGMFLFPGLIGQSFHLPPAIVAGLYGATFVTCGLVTVLQGTFMLRLPIVMGPFAGTFAAILAAGHAAGLGAAFGSLFVASVLWALISLPVAGGAVVGWLARVFDAPIVYAGILLIAMSFLSTISLSNWVGAPGQPGFGAANWVGGGVCVVAVLLSLLFGRGVVRRGAVLWGIVLGTAAYALFAPVSLSRIGQSGWLWVPHAFPFGFSVNPILVALFFLMLTTASCTALSQYHLVSRWGNEDVGSTRMSAGIFTESVGAAIAAVVGGISTTAYPDNVGILKVSRVGSVFVTVLAGAILLVLGFVLKFDAVFVVIPPSVIAAAATVMFGMILVAAVGMLRDVQWDTINSIVLGFPFMVSLGGLFVSPATLQTYPLLLRTAIEQPILTGSLLIVVLHLALNLGLRRWWARDRSAQAQPRASAT